MPIHYALFENNLTSDPSDFAAIVQSVASVDLDGVVDRMVERGSTTTRADILAVLEDAIGASESMLLDGMRVNFGGLIELFPRVRGVFTGATDAFDPARHSLDVGANPGSRVRKTVRDNAAVVKDEATKPTPNPIEYRDIGSDTTNDTVGWVGGYKAANAAGRQHRPAFGQPPEVRPQGVRRGPLLRGRRRRRHQGAHRPEGRVGVSPANRPRNSSSWSRRWWPARTTWTSGPEWAAARRPANCVSDVWTRR